MDDFFDDEETKEILITIQKLCNKLNWTVRTISIDDEEGGIGGLIIGSEDIIADMLLEDPDIGEEDTLH